MGLHSRARHRRHGRRSGLSAIQNRVFPRYRIGSFRDTEVGRGNFRIAEKRQRRLASLAGCDLALPLARRRDLAARRPRRRTRRNTMQINRRGFMGGSAAAITLAAVFGGRAFAQGVETLKYAGAARGLRTIDPHKSIQGVDNWAIIAIYDKLVDLPRWQFPATLNELVP